MRPGQVSWRLPPAPYSLIMRLYNGFTATSSDYVKERMAQGLWRKDSLSAFLRMLQAQKEQADAAKGELAAPSEQPADRAEAIRGS